jgi:hypothetical protein
VLVQLKNYDGTMPNNPSTFHDSRLQVACVTFDITHPASPGVSPAINWCSPGTAPDKGATVASLGNGQYNVTFTVQWLLAAPAYRFSHDARCGQWYFDACRWRSHYVDSAQQGFLISSAMSVFDGTPSSPIPASFYLPTNAAVNQTLLGIYDGAFINGSGVGLELRPGSSVGRDTHYLPRAQTYRQGAASAHLPGAAATPIGAYLEMARVLPQSL